MKQLLLLLVLTLVVGCHTNNDCQSKPWEYQVTLEDSVIVIYNNDRYVADVPYDRIGVLDSIFIDDNQ